LKNSAYYYCYRRVIEDYAAYVKRAALANVVDRQCAYCNDFINGPLLEDLQADSESKNSGSSRLYKGVSLGEEFRVSVVKRIQQRRLKRKTMPISRTPNGSNAVLKKIRKQQSKKIGKLLDIHKSKLPEIGDVL
jgi:hypothetical protein